MKRKFQYKIVCCFTAFCMIMTVAAVRVYTAGGNAALQTDINTANSYVFELNNLRGNIYDCNGKPLTGDTLQYYSLNLSGKRPVLNKCDAPQKDKNIYSFCTAVRYSGATLARHLLGYTDLQNKGVTGIEKAYDDILFCDDYLKISIPKRADGTINKTAKPEIYEGAAGGAVYLTIDKDIQRIAENNCKEIKKGAVVITEASSGKIRALASFPNYNQNDVAKSLNDDASPLINRALGCFSVGSVFKPCIAICALEAGIGGFTHTCTGNLMVEGHLFNCHKLDGHGNMNLKNAIAQSCNTYFYSVAQKIDAAAMYNKATRLGFGASFTVCDGISTAAADLPPCDLLKNSKSTVANFAIGQGSITASPLVLSNLYCAIANGGFYHMPTLVEKTVKDGTENYTQGGAKIKVTRKEYADYLKTCLKEVIISGTGKAAASDIVDLCGKTATAQTGQKDKSGELLNLWFCGFFPNERPVYTVVILKEGAHSGEASLCKNFKNIAQDITINKNLLDKTVK